jgi:cytoskeletal protein RodZ
MTKNQKIAAGCGGLGCLGLIVLLIIACVGYFFWYKPSQEPARNFNARPNSNSSNSNSTSNSNSNSNTTEPNSNSTSNSSASSSSSYSDDEKHRLFQAASMSGDADLVQKVVKKTGLFTPQGYPAEGYQQFVQDHIAWGTKNADFIQSLDSKEKAKAYVDEHL